MSLPRVIIISLKQHEKRRIQLTSTLKDLGFKHIHHLKAVDGSKLHPEPPWPTDVDTTKVSPWSNWVDPYARRALTLGEVGCTLSHVHAWRRVLGSYKPAIILEDDAQPVLELIDALPSLLEDLQHVDAPLCYLSQRNAPGPQPLIGRHIHSVTYHPLWTLAYLLTPSGAKALLSSPWNEHLIPSDELLPAAFGLNRNPLDNQVYDVSDDLVASSNQPFFVSGGGGTSSKDSTTEKSSPVRELNPELTVLTVATKAFPAKRLLDSGSRYGVNIKLLGLGDEWRGGDLTNSEGGGQKINLLRAALSELPPRQPVMFVDGYDTILTRHAADIIARWRSVCEDGNPLFAAEVSCWPDNNQDRYPEACTPYRFLNSGAFIGAAEDLRRMLIDAIADRADDQRYYTERYLSNRYNIQLDTQCQVFQCLNGSLEDVVVDAGRGCVYNKRTQSWPCVIHANGPTKDWLDTAGRAVGGRYRLAYGSIPSS